MPKKTIILIVILLLVTAGLVYIAINTEQAVPPDVAEEEITEEEVSDIVPTINPLTEITFLPSILYTENFQSVHSVEVAVNTNGQSIAGVQLELSYDPSILTNVTVAPAANNLFGINPAVQVSSVDPELGRISFAVALGSIDGDEVSGIGNIAIINFVALPANVPTTQISVLPKTTVRTLNSTNSLLRNALPLEIVLGSQITDTPTPSATDISQ